MPVRRTPRLWTDAEVGRTLPGQGRSGLNWSEPRRPRLHGPHADERHTQSRYAQTGRARQSLSPETRVDVTTDETWALFPESGTLGCTRHSCRGNTRVPPSSSPVWGFPRNSCSQGVRNGPNGVYVQTTPGVAHPPEPRRKWTGTPSGVHNREETTRTEVLRGSYTVTLLQILACTDPRTTRFSYQCTESTGTPEGRDHNRDLRRPRGSVLLRVPDLGSPGPRRRPQ